LNSLITLFKAMKNDKFFDQIIKWHKCFGKRTEPHQDSAAYKAIVKWENAGKGIRQTGFVPSVYGLALVYGISIGLCSKVLNGSFFFLTFLFFDEYQFTLGKFLKLGFVWKKKKISIFYFHKQTRSLNIADALLICMFDCYRFTSIFISRTNWFQGIPTV